MEFGLKWVHMARYELILRLDRALWLPMIFKPLLTPQRAITIQFESYVWLFVTEKVSMICNVTFAVHSLGSQVAETWSVFSGSPPCKTASSTLGMSTLPKPKARVLQPRALANKMVNYSFLQGGLVPGQAMSWLPVPCQLWPEYCHAMPCENVLGKCRQYEKTNYCCN